MAFQVQVCRPTSMAATGSIGQSIGGNLLCSTKQSVVYVAGDRPTSLVTGRCKRVSLKSRCSLETTAAAVTEAEAVAGQVTEVNKDTFWPIVKAAGDKPVVLDMFTQWCGPCKVMAPKFQKLSEEYHDTIFLKLDCNQENRALAKELGIKVVPTFKILRHGKIVKEITGAKYEDLVAAIQSVRSS